MSISVALFLSVDKIVCFFFQASAGADGSPRGEGLSLIEMLHRMGWPARIVAIILAFMSIYSIALMLERWLTFNAARNESRQFAPRAAAALREQHIETAILVTEQHKKSHLAVVVNAGLLEYRQQEAEESGAPLAEAIRDAVERAKALKGAELSRGLSGLATIGSSAPFVGLLGTVIGIINAFQGMNMTGNTGLETVAGGISEALVETAFGLIVAIPAVWTFNHFTNRLEAFRVEMNNSSSELLVYLKKHARRSTRLAAD